MPIGKSFQLLEQPHVDANGTVSCHMGSTHRTWNKGCGHAEKLLAGNLRSKTLNSAMSYRNFSQVPAVSPPYCLVDPDSAQGFWIEG
jgi:hypothetical protein